VIVMVALATSGCGDGRDSTEPTVTDPAPAHAATTGAPAGVTTGQREETAGAEVLPPPSRPMSWQAAGAFVWHETDIDPGYLASQLADNGFGWVVVFLHDGTTEDAIEADWVRRFRLASGLPVGGWGVLRSAPRSEAELADTLVRRYGLDFYVANAEADYEYSGPSGPDGARYRRSQRFVDAFRALQPDLPSGLSTYCRADMHDLDWDAWRAGGFVLLPQAYVNDFGDEAAPAACAQGARGLFPPDRVHPTIGMHPGQESSPAAAAYGPLLELAGTTGFSVYLAETRMTPEDWQALGADIARLGIARP
jgi:hypothetical protein